MLAAAELRKVTFVTGQSYVVNLEKLQVTILDALFLQILYIEVENITSWWLLPVNVLVFTSNIIAFANRATVNKENTGDGIFCKCNILY